MSLIFLTQRIDHQHEIYGYHNTIDFSFFLFSSFIWGEISFSESEWISRYVDNIFYNYIFVLNLIKLIDWFAKHLILTLQIFRLMAIKVGSRQSNHLPNLNLLKLAWLVGHQTSWVDVTFKVLTLNK